MITTEKVEQIKCINAKIELLRSGDDSPNSGLFEEASYQLIAKALLGENLADAGWKTIDQTTLRAIVHHDFEDQNEQYLIPLLASREKASDRFREIHDLFRIHAPEFYKKLTVFEPPAVCIQLDNQTELGESLGISTDIILNALNECKYWTASEHMIFGSKTMQNHDYFSKMQQRTTEYREYDHQQALEKALEDNSVHEKFHLISDVLTKTRFGEYHTWLNEGAAEFFANRTAICKNNLIAASIRPTIDVIFSADDTRSTSYPLLYWGGCLLIFTIGESYDEDPKIGVIKFMEKLFGNGDKIEENINQATLEILQKDNKLERVRAEFERLLK